MWFNLRFPTLSLAILHTPDIVHPSTSGYCICCLSRAPWGCLWYSPIVHLVLDLSWLPMYLSGNWSRMNNGRPCHSMERRLSSNRDYNLGSGNHTNRWRLCIIRHCSNSTSRLRLGTTTFPLEDRKKSSPIRLQWGWQKLLWQFSRQAKRPTELSYTLFTPTC